MAQSRDNRQFAVSESFGEHLRRMRESAYLTTADLAAKAGISVREVQRLENGTERRPRRNTLIWIARALNVPLDHLVGVEPQTQRLVPSSMSFSELEQIARRIDGYLLRLIRDHRHADGALLAQAHADLVAAQLHRVNASVDSFCPSTPDALASLLQSLPPPDLTIEVDPNWDKIDYCCGHVRLSVPHPLLLWDCHCKTPGSHFSSRACPIHGQPGGDVITAAFHGGHVEIRFGHLRLRWRRDEALWPPSVDSILMFRSLTSAGVVSERHSRLLDLGSGTGFLGLAFAAACPYVSELTLADWLLTPLLYGTVNAAIQSATRPGLRINPKIGLFTSWTDAAVASSSRFDLLVSNPPYLPLLAGYESLGQRSCVAGTDLLSHTIRTGHRVANRVIVQCSHIAQHELMQAANAANSRVVEIGAPLWVPFRVTTAWEHSGYVDALKEHRGLSHRFDERHPYWHKVGTFEIVSR